MAIEWTGDPLLYPRSQGAWGIIMHRFHYLFDAHGRVESMQPVSRPVLETLLKSIFKKPEMVRKRVVFPAPLRPTTTTTSPASTSMETSKTTLNFWYETDRSLTRRIS